MNCKIYLKMHAICHPKKTINYQKELCTRKFSNLIHGLAGHSQADHNCTKLSSPLSKVRRVQNWMNSDSLSALKFLGNWLGNR